MTSIRLGGQCQQIAKMKILERELKVLILNEHHLRVDELYYSKVVQKQRNIQRLDDLLKHSCFF